MNAGEMNGLIALPALIAAGLISWRLTGRTSGDGACRQSSSTIRGGDVQRGDIIGLGQGLGLRVEQVVFEGEDGLLIGRADCSEPIDNGRHGMLRPGQPYAAVVTASGELSWIKAGF